MIYLLYGGVVLFFLQQYFYLGDKGLNLILRYSLYKREVVLG